MFFGNIWEEHQILIGKDLSYLEANGFTVKSLKHTWAIQEANWLGYGLTPSGPQPRKNINCWHTSNGWILSKYLNNFLKSEEIIYTHITMIPSTQSTILGWTSMLMRPEDYALSESNPWQDPVNHGAVPPHMGNLMTTEVEGKHHHGLWKI